MGKIKCKNCGASFDDELSNCPYCGTMNKKGAYREFRMKISAMIDSILGLKDDIHSSVSKIIFGSFLRSLILIVLIVGLGFVFSRFINVNYMSDKKYDEEAYEEIIWMDEHLDALNEAFENDDFKTIEKIYYERTGAVSRWSHYPDYCLRSEFAEIMGEEKFDEYVLKKGLQFLFYPEYFTGYSAAKRIDKEDYSRMRDELLLMFEENGFEYSKLKDIFEKYNDGYGNLRLDDLKPYIKEAE